jgi:hypothetical protein
MDAEKQNDTILRVRICPYYHLATKGLMSFVVFAASSASRMTPSKAGGTGGEKHTFIILHATFNKYLDFSFIIRSRDFIPLAFIEEERP